MQERFAYWFRVMLAGIQAPIALVSLIVLVVGGSVALSIPWGQKHLPWGIVALLAAIVVTLAEGSYLEKRRLENLRRDDLAAQREKHAGEVTNLRDEYQERLNGALTAALAGNREEVPDPADWKAYAESDGNGILMFYLQHRRGNVGVILDFTDFWCTVVNPVGEVTQISGRSINTGRWGCMIQYYPGICSGAPPVRNGTYTFKWRGEDKKGTWHALAEGMHEVFLDRADERENPS